MHLHLLQRCIQSNMLAFYLYRHAVANSLHHLSILDGKNINKPSVAASPKPKNQSQFECMCESQLQAFAKLAAAYQQALRYI